jgi:hypothetical protein
MSHEIDRFYETNVEQQMRPIDDCDRHEPCDDYNGNDGCEQEDRAVKEETISGLVSENKYRAYTTLKRIRLIKDRLLVGNTVEESISKTEEGGIPSIKAMLQETNEVLAIVDSILDSLIKELNK